MIGSEDIKMGYYNKGLINTIIPMLEKADLDLQVRLEIFTVLNSFLFECPKTHETFRLFREKLIGALN